MSGKHIESLRGSSPADRYSQLVQASKSAFQQSDGSLVMTPAEFQAALNSAASVVVAGQRDVQSLIAYSSINWVLTKVDNTTTWTISLAATAANTRKFFQYGVDDQLNVVPLGGFPAGYQARWDDTNLTKAGKPPFGPMAIDTVACMIRYRHPECWDQDINANIMSKMSLAIGTNGTKRLRHLGSPIFWSAQQGIKQSGLVAGAGLGVTTLGMGLGPSHVRHLEEPIIWNATGGVDDDLVVEASIDHDTSKVVTVSYQGTNITNYQFSLWCIVSGKSADYLSANG